MKNIVTIASKEFLDTLRDRRTLIMMIIVPILLFPIVFTLINRLQSSVMAREQEKSLQVGLISRDAGNDLVAFLEGREDMTIHYLENAEEVTHKIRQDELQVGIVIEEGFSRQLELLQSGTVRVMYSAAKLTVKNRIDRILQLYVDKKLLSRVEGQGYDQSFMKPVELVPVNVATSQEVMGKMAGGFLPYIFVIFCFMGGMYPAIDLFTGEKERKTLETILTTPVSRLEILIGKMLVIVSSGILSAVLAILGLFVAFQLTADMPAMITEVVSDMLNIRFVLLTLLMLVPLTVFFAGVMVPITIYSKTFKEAQSMLTPFTFLIIFPAMIGLLPGIELTALTAIIPIVNISLATKEILADTIQLPFLLLTVVSLFTYASLAVGFCVKWFGNESNVLR
ncbi:MAG: ABC transporter permease [Bacteroidales bacterium]